MRNSIVVLVFCLMLVGFNYGYGIQNNEKNTTTSTVSSTNCLNDCNIAVMTKLNNIRNAFIDQLSPGGDFVLPPCPPGHHMDESCVLALKTVYIDEINKMYDNEWVALQLVTNICCEQACQNGLPHQCSMAEDYLLLRIQQLLAELYSKLTGNCCVPNAPV